MQMSTLYFKSTTIFLKLQLFDNTKESPLNLQVYPKIESDLEQQNL